MPTPYVPWQTPLALASLLSSVIPATVVAAGRLSGLSVVTALAAGGAAWLVGVAHDEWQLARTAPRQHAPVATRAMEHTATPGAVWRSTPEFFASTPAFLAAPRNSGAREERAEAA